MMSFYKVIKFFQNQTKLKKKTLLVNEFINQIKKKTLCILSLCAAFICFTEFDENQHNYGCFYFVLLSQW